MLSPNDVFRLCTVICSLSCPMVIVSRFLTSGDPCRDESKWNECLPATGDELLPRFFSYRNLWERFSLDIIIDALIITGHAKYSEILCKFSANFSVAWNCFTIFLNFRGSYLANCLPDIP